ncbi:MAG: type II toxin-antitoxin system RelE/ParE family toxin [Actinomycetota bacterium]|nr:type II toxin-antitoxin system RelE/ParE family toxin [Actinomycetota bacterium]
MDEGLIFQGRIAIRAIPDRRRRFPVKQWLGGLSARDQRRADAGMINFDRLEAAGVPNSGRVEMVRGRRWTMLELKLTRGGTPGAQLRVLGVMKGRTFWAAHGFKKTTRRISAADIDAAEAALDGWGGSRRGGRKPEAEP